MSEGAQSFLSTVGWITVGFFVVALLMFLFFVVSRRLFSYAQHLHEQKKDAYKARLREGKSFELSFVKSLRSRIVFVAAVNAVGEMIEEAASEEEKKHYLDFVRKERLDIGLKTIFLQSWTMSARLYAISHASRLYSYRLKSFYRLVLEGKYRFEIKEHAAYAYALVSETSEDLVYLWGVIDRLLEEEHCSLKFGEFLARLAFERVPQDERQSFFYTFVYNQEAVNNVTMVYVSALGDKQFRAMHESLLWLYGRHPLHALLSVNILRALSKMGVRECDMVHDLYPSNVSLVRIVVANYWYTLCPDFDRKLLLPYLVEEDFKIMRYTIESLKASGAEKDRIVRLLESEGYEVTPRLEQSLNLLTNVWSAA